MKLNRLIALFIALSVCIVFGQAPPVLRNFFSTNTIPVVESVQGSNTLVTYSTPSTQVRRYTVNSLSSAYVPWAGSTQYMMALDGDSRMAGNGPAASPGWVKFFTNSVWGTPLVISNYSASGKYVDDPSGFYGPIGSQLMSSNYYWYVRYMKTNNPAIPGLLLIGGGILNLGDYTALETFQMITNYAGIVKADGWRLGMSTIMDWGNYPIATRRDIVWLNYHIANCGLWDYLFDFAGIWKDTGDTNNFVDNLHCTTNACQAQARYVLNQLSLSSLNTIPGTQAQPSWWYPTSDIPSITIYTQKSTNITVYGTLNANNPNLTNGINWGNAFSSRGGALNAEQFGKSASASFQDSIALGAYASANNNGSISIGSSPITYGNSSIALGYLAESDLDYDISIGVSSLAGGQDSIAIGRNSTATNISNIAIGKSALSTGSVSIAIGPDSIAGGDWGTISIGDASYSFGGYSTAIGEQSEARTNYSTAIGAFSVVNGSNSSAFGRASSVQYNNSTAIGAYATTTTNNQIVLGTVNDAVVAPNDLFTKSVLTTNSTGSMGISTNGSLTLSNGANGSWILLTNGMGMFSNGNGGNMVTITNGSIILSNANALWTNVFGVSNVAIGSLASSNYQVISNIAQLSVNGGVLTVTSNRVGINKPNPGNVGSYTLDVVGTIRASDDISSANIISAGANSSASTFFNIASSSRMYAPSNGLWRFTDSSQNGAQIMLPKTVLDFTSSENTTNTIIYSQGTNLVVSDSVTAPALYLSGVPTNGVAPPTSVTQPVGLFGCMMMSGVTNTVTVASSGTYYTLTNYQTLRTNGFTASPGWAKGSLTNTVSGFYRVSYYVACVPAGASQTIETEVFLNETGKEEISSFSQFDNPARVRTISGSGILYIPANTGISLRINNNSGANNVDVWRASLTVSTP